MPMSHAAERVHMMAIGRCFSSVPQPTSQPRCERCRETGMLTKLLGEQVLTITPKLADSIISEYSGAHDSDGNFSGKGRAVFRNGNIYDGQFERGNMHGNGVMIWPNGVKYDN